MKKRTAQIVGAVVVAASLFAIAATNTVSYSDLHNVKSITFTWSNLASSGHIPAAPTNDLVCVVTSKVVSGYIERVVLTACNATGAFVHVSIKDADGIDLLRGSGALISSTAPVSFAPAQSATNAIGFTHIPVAFESALVLTVTNCLGTTSTNTGTLKVYYHE